MQKYEHLDFWFAYFENGAVEVVEILRIVFLGAQEYIHQILCL